MKYFKPVSQQEFITLVQNTKLNLKGKWTISKKVKKFDDFHFFILKKENRYGVVYFDGKKIRTYFSLKKPTFEEIHKEFRRRSVEKKLHCAGRIKRQFDELTLWLPAVQSDGPAEIRDHGRVIMTFPEEITPGGKFLHNWRAKNVWNMLKKKDVTTYPDFKYDTESNCIVNL